MSLELLILLALFTLLPIIEQAWRKHREARERARRRALGLPPVPPPLPPPIPRIPPGHAPLPTRTDAFDEDDESDVEVLRHTPQPRPVPIPIQVVPRPAAAPLKMPVRRAVAPLARRRAVPLREIMRDPGAVRRGIVLMTVLGPCRANAPYDVSPVGQTTGDR